MKKFKKMKKGLTSCWRIADNLLEQSRAEQSRAEQSRAEQSRILIWGTGGLYNTYFNLVKLFEARGDFRVIGVTSNDSNIRDNVDGFPFFAKRELSKLEFDYCFVAAGDFAAIKKEAGLRNIDTAKLIPIRVLSIPYFSFEAYISLKQSNLSILSNDCFGGFCYHSMGLEYLSPTINLFFKGKEYNQFLARLDEYLALPVEYIGEKYQIGAPEATGHRYPVGKLGDIELHFLHYETFSQAVERWEARKARLNRENLLVICSTNSLDVAKEFDALPYDNLCVFVPFDCDLAASYNIVGRDNDSGLSVAQRAFKLAQGYDPRFDMLKFLRHEKNYTRLN